MTGTGEAVAFWALAIVAVPAALALLFAKRAVHAAIGMVVTMIILGAFYLLQEAPFLGVVHIFVYTGAVMMLFLFVVMLVGVDHSDSLVETLTGQRFLTVLLSLATVALLVGAISGVTYEGDPNLSAVSADPGNVEAVAYLIFGRYVWVFEVTTALLVTAAIGAMVLAHRERIVPRPTQRQWMERRFREGQHLSGLPAPGVYARHNAVDTPALLPDGTVSELSLNRVLVARDQVTAPTRYVEVDEAAADTAPDREIADTRERHLHDTGEQLPPSADLPSLRREGAQHDGGHPQSGDDATRDDEGSAR
ncbi:hypothetical protein GCM10027055_04880 [Janibacter alkaliphilus]|uniref:NADH-quinone oxidoreductase subunit J n=1 Tax=Janibacter alkaliphilus TaxID=1069963 RepID=A0A852X8L9_9MICO|nr:NADH-quinone oxidoreductase subunit J [Janibacter alkaliphilus]